MQAMPSDFPRFRYHPDPVATGTVMVSDTACLCCQRVRGFVYACGPYARRSDLDGTICQWCIADGSVARAFDAGFFQNFEHVEGGVRPAPAIVDELAHRTPGYVSWQGEQWLVHCEDPMAFHGDVSPHTLQYFDEAARDRVRSELSFLFDRNFGSWEDLVAGYAPGGDLALDHVRCLDCGVNRLGCDFS